MQHSEFHNIQKVTLEQQFQWVRSETYHANVSFWNAKSGSMVRCAF